jgi:hypothetical protein
VPSDQRHLALVQRPLDAGKPGLAEGVVLIEDGDLGDTEILGQTLDHGLGFLEIGGADVDHVGLVGLA